MTAEALTSRVTLHPGDCLDVLATLAENSIDSCVTDPPYHLVSIVKRFGKAAGNFGNGYGSGWKPEGNGLGAAFARTSRGFMGQQWDGGDVAFQPETWAAVYRVLKPGAHLLAMGGTRTYHRLACAIEDAGFEVRDCINWLYGSGFPKSHDISKAIDRAAGAKGEFGAPKSAAHAGWIERGRMRADDGHEGYQRPWMKDEEAVDRNARQYIPATDAAKEWEGWGTALKPACELIVLTRKPLSEPAIAANVLKWGTGAINIDGCRVATNGEDRAARYNGQPPKGEGANIKFGKREEVWAAPEGRWPANVIHDGSEEVVGAFPDAPGQLAAVGPQHGAKSSVNCYGDYGPRDQFNPRSDAGSAARFFYTAKADSDDRLGSKHPTVKPVDLIQYLVRLVTPKGGLVLDPFAGTGTLGEACIREGMKAVLIEREAEYCNDIRRRMKLAMVGPDERARESAKAKNPTPDHGPLFAFADEYDAAKDLAGSLDECYRAIRERKANGGEGWKP